MTRARNTADTQTASGGPVSPSIAGKNAIINGGFDIWQRGTSFTPSGATTYYNADRFLGYSPAAGTTYSRQVTGDTTNLPNIQYCFRLQRNSGNTGTSNILTLTNLESSVSIPYAGKTVTVSFYARAGANYSATSNLLNYEFLTGTGTDQNVLVSYTGAVITTGTKTLTTTWQRFTYTVNVPSTATEMALDFYYTPTGTAGAADYFEITGVQLELGSVATPFSRAGGTIQGELAACQRYYWRTGGDNVYQTHAIATAVVGNGGYGFVNNPVPMRAAPTSMDYSTLKVSDAYSLNIAITSMSIDAAGRYGSYFGYVVASGLSTFRPYFLQSNNSTSAYLGFSAEL